MAKKRFFHLMLYGTLCCFGFQFHPGAMMHTGKISKSQWLWNQDRPVENFADSYFRVTFQLEEEVTTASLKITFDDNGDIFLNGKNISSDNFHKHLQTGKNVMAICLKNIKGPAGMVFLAKLQLKSGKIRYLHSDESIKATANAATGWEQPDFDDATWKSARLQGDVTTRPWSFIFNYLPDYTTEEEKQIYENEVKAACFLPPGLENESEPVAKIVYSGWRPQLSINGKLYDPYLNLSGAASPYLDNLVIGSSQIGMQFFRIDTATDQRTYRKSDGTYDFSYLDLPARRILTLNPNAWLEITFRIVKDEKWCLQNPDETIGYGDGDAQPAVSDEYLERALRPSAASVKLKQETLEKLREMAAYIKSMPWGKRVVAVRVSWGIFGEWHTYGMYHAPDCGKPMTEAFRNWLTKKYSTDDALQKAWKTPGVTIASAAAPTTAERTNGGALLDPVKNRKTLDFYDCLTNVNADLLLAMAHEIKTHLPGRLCGAYYGYLFTPFPVEGSNILLDKVLASPDIDFLSDPAFYSNDARRAGGAFPQRTIPSIHRRYGKLSLLEDDSRFHHQEKAPWKTETPRESRMVVRRNCLNGLFNGTGIQILDPGFLLTTPHAFDDPAVLEGIQEARQIIAKQGTLPEDSGADTAVVVQYRDYLYRDGAAKVSRKLQEIFENSINYLYKTGTAFDLMTVGEYLAVSKRYRQVLFLHTFVLDKAERQALRSKTHQQGVTAIWMLAPGCLTEKGFSDQAMTELSGMNLKGSGINLDVRCIDRDARKVLDGVFEKKLSSGAHSIFVSQAPDSAEFYRKLLQYAGVWCYTEDCGGYFRRHDNLFMYHTATPGQHKITLPEKSGEVTELFSGQTYPASNLTLETDGPVTWLFKLN